MKNLPIDTLRSFVVLAETGGFTQTAERMGRTQPAISQQIKRLEELLGRTLFFRQEQRAQLTAAGSELLLFAQQILNLNDQAVSQFETPYIDGKLRFGIPSEFAVSLLPKIINQFAKAYPGVTLEVFSDLSRNLVAESQRDEYDLILALQDRPAPANPQHIKTEELVWVGASGAQALWRDRSLQNTKAQGSRSQSARSQNSKTQGRDNTVSLIAAPDGCIYRQRALRRLAQAKIPWHITYTNPDLTGIQAAIEEGMGITVLARSTVPRNLSIIEAPKHLPKLGVIGVSLKLLNSKPGNAERVLADYVKAGLKGNGRL